MVTKVTVGRFSMSFEEAREVYGALHELFGPGEEDASPEGNRQAYDPPHTQAKEPYISDPKISWPYFPFRPGDTYWGVGILPCISVDTSYYGNVKNTSDGSWVATEDFKPE